MPDLLECGRVLNTHGIRGDIKSTLGAIRRWYLSSCRPFTSTAIPIRWKKAAPISLLCCASSRASIPRRPPWLSKTRPFFSTRKKCRWKTAPIFWPTSWGLKPMTNDTGQVIGTLQEVRLSPASDLSRATAGPQGGVLIPAVPAFAGTRGFPKPPDHLPDHRRDAAP